jgi:Fe-S-cluster-containing dehydrogenase component
MKKWNLIVDVAQCSYCNNCTMAEKDEYEGNTFPGYSVPQPRHGHYWIRLQRRERGSGSLMDVAYLPTMCNQCDRPPCLGAAPPGAVYKRPDGIVMIDPVKAKGQKQLVEACPYGHIWWNEEQQVPQKYFFDAHLLDQGWTAPRAVKVCACGALEAAHVTDEEMQTRATAERLEVLRPELGTRPRVWYRNLYRFTREHIAGSVVTVVHGLEEVCESAAVTLLKDGETVASAVTDFFGDFKFDALEPESGSYVVRAEWKGMAKETTARLGQSVNVGVILLAASGT